MYLTWVPKKQNDLNYLTNIAFNFGFNLLKEAHGKRKETYQYTVEWGWLTVKYIHLDK